METNVNSTEPVPWRTVVAEAEKITARVVCTALVIDNTESWQGGRLVYLEAFAPAQEARAFAQILRKTFSLVVTGGEGSAPSRHRGLRVEGDGLVRTDALKHGYRWIVAVPSRRYIVGATEEECFQVYADTLDQEHLVLRDWYRLLFDGLPRIPSQIGRKVCVRTDLPVQEAVAAGLADGTLTFPEPKLVLRLPKGSAEELAQETAAA